MRNNNKVRLIAEAGCNHKGELEIAKELIQIAAIYCKADVIKFQKRNNRELLSAEQYNAPHPNPVNSYGDTYGAHREFLEFDLQEHIQLKKWCDEYGIVYSSSVWDLTSAQEIASIKPELIKIPSASNNHFEMLEWLCKNYQGEIHLSFGMTTQKEEKEIVDLFSKNKRNKDLVIYACTSGYPVPFEDVSLYEIVRLKNEYGNQVKEIGFSGHHLGTAIDIAALTLGATTIERHYTLDRTWKGTDHAASLEPEEIKKLKKELTDTEKALSYKKKEILDIEKVQRKKLKYRA
ncbi:N-acetylneuraminate synthase family protein [Eubacteriaceae bacterium ES3]|nr:N-acetylneuraminate synthase family protein [Eubacteriaceae bacterium ES3]